MQQNEQKCCKKTFPLIYNTVEPPLSNPFGRVTIRSDNRKVGYNGKPKITGLNGSWEWIGGRIIENSDNRGSDNRGSTVHIYRLHSVRDVSEKRKLLTLIIHGTEALLYTKEIYSTPYIPLYRSITARGG